MADTEPTAVVSRYRRYKAGTKKVVGWLARSASTCCDVAAKFSCFQSGSTSRSEIKVPSKVLTALADIIASAEADVAVPKHILQVLEDVIELRTECATWYGAQAVSDSTDLAARNKSHQHFIKVLKEVHAMLSKSTNIQASATTTSQSEENKSSKSKKNKKGPRKNSLDKLANLFEMLDLEEPILTPLGEAPSPSSKPPNEWNGKSLSLEDDQDNEAVALWYFLTDMNDVRQNVRQLWLEYLEGQTRLAVAGMVTETALGMIERASNDFVRQWPGFTDWMSMPEYLRITIGINNNLVYLFCKYSNALTKHAAANPSPADLICPTASFLLRTFAEGAWTFQQSLTTSDSGSLGGHVDGNRLSAERPYSEFEEVLLFMLPALTSLKTWKECYELTKRPTQLNLSIHDHSKITDGLMSLIDANQDIPVLDTPIWLVFACQICMDINEVVQGMGTCGADGLLKTTTDIQNSLNEALTWVQKEMNVSAFATRKSEFQLLESLVAGFKDNIKTIRRLESAKKISPLDTDDTWVLYKSRCTIPGLEVLPYRAALMIHAFKDWSYDLLTGVGNDDHAIVAMAHLYGAAKGRGLLQVPWEDMIFLERIQSGRKPLVTKTRNEASIMEYLRHYAIDLGADVAATIKPEFPANLDWKRMLKNGKQVSNRLSELRWAFRERHEENQVLGHQRGNTYDVVLATFTDRRKREDQARGSMKSSSGQIKYSPLQLLQTLTGYSKRDEPRVNFDYAGFSRLYDHARHASSGRTEEGATYGYAFQILQVTAEFEAKSVPLSATPLAYVTRTLRAMIEKCGKDFFTKAQQQCSGRIPKSHLPKFENTRPDPSDDIAKLINKYPGLSVGTSRTTVEFYDSQGSTTRFNDLLYNNDMRKIMPQGMSKATHIIVPVEELGEAEETARRDLPDHKLTDVYEYYDLIWDGKREQIHGRNGF